MGRCSEPLFGGSSRSKNVPEKLLRIVAGNDAKVVSKTAPEFPDVGVEVVFEEEQEGEIRSEKQFMPDAGIDRAGN